MRRAPLAGEQLRWRGPIGSLDGAFEAIDWMVDAGCSLWVLPLSPTDPTGSPYSSWSAWSGNPELVGLDCSRARADR